MPSSRARPLNRLALLTLALSLAVASGCRPKAKPVDYTGQLPPGEKALRKIAPERWPDFAYMQTDRAALLGSVRNSLHYLGAPSSKRHFPYLDITHDRAVATLRAMEYLLTESPLATGAGDWNAAVRANFEVYQSVGAPKTGVAGEYTNQVLFTGYFTPVYDASLTRQGEYRWPLYKRPADLVTVNEETGAVEQRLPDGSTRSPYLSREQIERDNPLAGQELVWLKTRWEAYVITVQGSARLRLTDGRTYEIGYAGTNGHEYASPGAQMLKDGVIQREQLTLAGLRDHFAAHPEAMDKYLWANPRTTFFMERPGGPFGKLNVPVTPFATIATDKDVYPRAMPAFLSVPVPDAARSEVGPPPPPGVTNAPPGTIPFRGLMLDQDTGGAIRAAGRCDIYMGIGLDAERVAGQQLYPGALYYLAVKPELVGTYLGSAGGAGAAR